MVATRRLAAVMITDMVGYSAQTQRSEATALRLLEEHREIVRGVLHEFQGREVKTLGDGFLIEFGSALAATECGVEILRRLDARNRAHGGDRIDLRIGIHLGEVVPEGTDILGDAVNIASRLEPLAEPGGLIISGPVYDQVRGRTSVSIQPLPTPSLKHIFVPLTVYRVDLPWKAPPVAALTPWTDRETEYAELVRAHDRARQGHGSAVLLVGEPGTGKTRMVEEFLKGAAPSGLQLLRGQAVRGEKGVPYAVWSEAVRSYARVAAPAVLARACGRYLPEVARLVPEIVDRIGASTPLPPTEPELAEDRLMEGLVQFFANLAEEAPLVVVLDDLQWTDAYSQRLLRRAVKAAAGHRWLLIAAARDRDPSESPGVAELWTEGRREPGCSVITLGRLPGAEFDRFLDSLLPPPGLAPELRKRFHERCDGNPWFAEELLRRQVEGGVLRRADDGWTLDPSEELRIPDTIHHLLVDRLEGLDPATLGVLRAASVAGSRISYSLLRRVSGVPEDLLLICVERALRRRILEERATAGGEVELAFRDTLTRDVLYEGLSLVRARTYHRLVGEGLELLPERERREQASQLADHFLRGLVPEKALEYSLLAATRAVELHAHPEAEHLYRTALELMDEVPTPDARRAETLGALAKELELLGRTSLALEKYAASAELWERSGQARRASSVHSWMAMLLNDLPGREKEVVGHSERAVALLQAEGESAELAQAVYSLAAETMRWGGDAARARALFRQSVDLAERFGDSRTEAFGTYFLATVLPFDRKDEAIGLASRLVAKLESKDDATLPILLFNVGVNLFLAGKGDVPSARQHLEKAREIARRKGIRRYDTAIALGLAEADRVAGGWSSAEAVARGVLASEPQENLLERVEASFLLARLASGRG
ncbi:MAG TPA: AAA family ATPase, partial [Thermoplasmata archaeon]|nr:AAA family ATPase [Thermoplasmata archaeon]